MATPPAFFHALLRPAMLQILRATGYHATRPAVLDSLTDLAARYLLLLCQHTAAHAADNHRGGPQQAAGDFALADVRLALQDVGAFGPGRGVSEEGWRGEEDLRGVEEFIAWFAGQRMRELMEFGNADGESEATDYLSALKKKHNQAGGDAKFQGTILGRPGEGAEVLVEGGQVTTIEEWMAQRSPELLRDNTNADGGKRPASSGSSSSGLSSVGSERRDGGGNGDFMDLS